MLFQNPAAPRWEEEALSAARLQIRMHGRCVSSKAKAQGETWPAPGSHLCPMTPARRAGRNPGMRMGSG